MVLTSTNNLCFEQKYEKYQNFFLSENVHFLVVKFSVYFIRRVFVIISGAQKIYVVGTHWKRLGEALLISTHNLCFCGEIKHNIMWIPLLSVSYVEYWVWQTLDLIAEVLFSKILTLSC